MVSASRFVGTKRLMEKIGEFYLRACEEISDAILLDLESVLFVVVAVTYLLWIRSRHNASITTSISAQYCITYFLTSPKNAILLRRLG